MRPEQELASMFTGSVLTRSSKREFVTTKPGAGEVRIMRYDQYNDVKFVAYDENADPIARGDELAPIVDALAALGYGPILVRR